jgi:uncharacterized protein YyaL (SSP411 family)
MYNPMQDPHGELAGQNVPIIYEPLSSTVADLNIVDVATASGALAQAHKLLATERSRRPPPHLDTKLITAWNGLMITGTCTAARALDDGVCVARAAAAARFVDVHLTRADSGELLRCAYSDDHSDADVKQM